MLRNYFEFEGTKYETGTGIKMLPFTPSKYSSYENAFFIYYDEENDLYAYRQDGRDFYLRSEKFWRHFGGLTGKFDSAVHMPQTKQLKDSQIPGLFIGWVWYIFIMLIAVIFNDRIGIWIIASIVFFNWRKKKIKEEGYYVEW